MTTDPKRPYSRVDLTTFTDSQREAFNILSSWRQSALVEGTGLLEIYGPSLAPEKLAALQKEAIEFVTDGTLHRYVVARNFDTEAALSLLKGSLKWRSTFISSANLPEKASSWQYCEKCDKAPTNHCLFICGWDDSGRTVAYGCQPRMRDSDVEGTVFHVMRSLEKSWLHPRSSQQYTYIVDFNGFGLRHATHVRMGIAWATLFSSQLPERLGHLLLINPPGIFDIFYSAGKKVADSRTLDKISILRGSSKEVLAKMSTLGINEPSMVWWLEKTFAADPYPKDAESIRMGTLPRLPVLPVDEARELGLLESQADAADEDDTLTDSKFKFAKRAELTEDQAKALRDRGIADLELALDLYEVQLVKHAPWVTG